MERNSQHDMSFTEMMKDSHSGMKDVLFNDKKTLAIGSILHFLFFLFIPILVLFGYEAKVMRNASRDRDNVPQFDNWGELIYMGVVSSILAPLLYTLLPVVGFSLIFYGLSAVLIGTSFEFLASSVIILFMVSVIAFILFSYALFAAIAAYADTGRVSALFDLSLIIPVVKTLDYLLAYLVITVILPIISMVGFMILGFTFIGVIAYPTLVFLDLVFTFRLMGLVYAKHSPDKS